MTRNVSTPESYQLLHKGIQAFARMEHAGIRIDVPYLDRTLVEIRDRIHAIETKLRKDPIYDKWRRAFGDNTKLDSRPQLGHVIFNLMKYEPKAWTETGRPSTDEAAFADMDVPFIKDYFTAAKLKKSAGTFLKGIKRETVNGFLHSNFHLHNVVSFRSASSQINFQNFPARNPEMAALIRRCFIPRKGRQLVETDFAGIEVRISATYHKDPTMINYIKDPSTDMHRDQAYELFCVTPEEYAPHKDYFKKTIRDSSKNMFVFPQFYGSVYFQCAPNIWEAMERRSFKLGPDGISIRKHLRGKGIKTLGKCDPKEKPVKGTFEYHVKQVEDKLWNERFAVYTQWKRDWWQQYQEEGGFRLHTGFYIHGSFKRNDVLNYPIQGAAFHCLLWVLIQLQDWLRKNKMKTVIVGQIHDSLISDCEPSELKDYLAKVKELVTVSLAKAWKWICVPMEVEAEVCPIDADWHQKKGVPL